MLGYLIVFVLLGLFVATIIHPYWFRQQVLYRQKHFASVEARHPFCVGTKQISERELCDLIKHKLPDAETERGSIKFLPGNAKTGVDPSQMQFAVLGNWWVGGRSIIRTSDGRQRPSTVKFSVIVDHKHDETIATLVTLVWTTHKGIFERYRDLIRAQDKMLALIQAVDKQAKAFTED
jgi:hypothetical protein